MDAERLRRTLETMFYPYRPGLRPTTDFDRGVDAVLDAIEHNPHLLAVPAVTETADLRAVAQRLLDEYDEDMVRSPSFVTMDLLRAALAASPDTEEASDGR